jgi:hypothetical protein
MQTASQILENSRRTNALSQLTQQPQANDKRMASLWLRFGKLFGSRWSSQYGDCDDGTWASVLRGVDSITLSDAVGRVAMGGSGFPPNLPEFLAICARAAGLPDSSSAYVAACHASWTHSVIYETARRVGLHELRTKSERDILPRWREHYGAACAAWMSGERWETPEIKTPICEVHRLASRELVMAQVASLRQMLAKVST